ncbi:MAG TPA: T9SS type A sorting domain-containing protein, partial [Rhodothermales bacterium]
VVNDSANTKVSFTPAMPLEYGAMYYWRVRGRNAGGNGAWSEARSFTTIVAAPEAVTLIHPADSAMGISVTPVFEWDALASALTYQLQVSDDASFSAPVVNDSALATTTDTVDVPLGHDTRHYWRVRARNAGGDGAWSEVRTFTTIVAAPEAVTLIHPADSAIGVSVTPVFEWDALASALTYQLHVSEDTSFTTLVLNDSALATTADTVNVPLGHDAQHYWRVRGRNAGGDGVWSQVRSFTTIIAAPEAVGLVSPEAGAQGVAAFMMFLWQPMDGAAAYHLQLSSDAAFTAPVVDDSVLTDPTFAVSEPLAYSATYYWHVRAALDDGLGKATGLLFGQWSDTRSFTVAVGTAAEGESDLPSTFALHPNYPNPFNPSTTIRYDVPEQALVKIAVYDALGRLVEILSTKYQVPGTYAATWDAAGRPTGVYFVRMAAGTFVASRRMILIR